MRNYQLKPAHITPYKQLQQLNATDRARLVLYYATDMQVHILLVVFFLCGVGKTQMPFQRKPPTIKDSKKSQLKAKLRALQNRFLNKTVDLSEVEQYGSAIYRNYTQELQKSIKRFQQVFKSHVRNEKNRTKNVQKCRVRQEERKMGRGVFPRRVKVRIKNVNHF